MARPRKEMIGINLYNRFYINVVYKEKNEKDPKTLTINLKEMLGVCEDKWDIFVPFLEFKLCKSGTTCMIYISTENMDRMKQEEFYLYNELSQIYKEANCFSVEIGLDTLIQAYQNTATEDEEYQVLYIGKSNSEKEGYDILKRLRSHETIQEICRDKEMDYRDMEIIVQVISFRSKLFGKIGGTSYFSMMVGDSNWEILLNVKQNHEVIELIEAILINHFKPKYNHKYKEKIDRESKVYKKVETEGIDTVSFEFDMATQQGKMKLVTSSVKTETKMRTFVCRREKDEISIKYDDMPDYVYDVLGGM